MLTVFAIAMFFKHTIFLVFAKKVCGKLAKIVGVISKSALNTKSTQITPIFHHKTLF